MMLNQTTVIPDAFQFTPEQFEQLAIVYCNLILEKTATCSLIANPVAGGNTRDQNLDDECFFCL